MKEKQRHRKGKRQGHINKESKPRDQKSILGDERVLNPDLNLILWSLLATKLLWIAWLLPKVYHIQVNFPGQLLFHQPEIVQFNIKLKTYSNLDILMDLVNYWRLIWK